MAHRKSPRRIAKAAKIAALTATGAHDAAELEAAIAGTIVVPGEHEYERDRQESNPAFQAYPRMIVYCEVPTDVRFAIAYARNAGWQIAIRSGGHSTAGYSVNDGLVIDISRISYVSVDSAAKVALVGAGTDFDTLNAALDGTGLHVPTGACGNVCVAGYMMGGGFGYTSRMYGMNCDNVVAVSVMLADGSIVVANATVNPDLFWAIRGGTGGNFGVLLEVTYGLHDLASVWARAIQWDELSAPESDPKLSGALSRRRVSAPAPSQATVRSAKRRVARPARTSRARGGRHSRDHGRSRQCGREDRSAG
jgi:hypothetical protein